MIYLAVVASGEGINWIREVALPIFLYLVIPLVWWYVRDRRKSRAESAVAERTVDSGVMGVDAGHLTASVAFVQEAFRVERASKDREIESLKVKVALQETEIAELRRMIVGLQEELARLRASRDHS